MRKLIVILAVIAMVGAFTATAMADVSLYGSARFRTYSAKDDPGTPGSQSDTDTEWRMGHLSRFGANFKSDKLTGKFEVDARAGGAGSTDPIEGASQASRLGNMRLRHLWGQYDFGSFKLMVGQNYPLYDAPVSGINYYSGGLQKFGGIGYDVARTGQIRLTFGNLRIAFLPMDTHVTTASVLGSTNPLSLTASDIDTTIPKIEVRYDMKMDPVTMNFIGGYQTYDVTGTYVNAAGSTMAFDESFDSWVLGFRGKANFGPAYLGLALTYRSNGGPYGAWTVAGENPIIDTDGSLKDATAFGVVGAIGFKVNDMFTLEGSIGSLSAEQDTILDNSDDRLTYGLLAKITAAPGVTIVPEFIFEDRDDRKVQNVVAEQGDVTIFGVFWKIDFK